MNEQKHVVIVGGGFGGLSAAKSLLKKKHRVTLIDKKNYHLFQPLLYQVAMGALSPAEIAYPLRGLIGQDANAEVLMDTVIGVDKKNKIVTTKSGDISYDSLILACGSTYTYFGSDQWEPFAPGLKTIAQATEIRSRVYIAFENAEKEKDPQKVKSLLTFIVVGGGPTGVELAGSLGEITRFNIHKDFDHIDPPQTKIILIEAGSRILPSMSEALSHEAMRELGELGVEIRLNARVSNINAEGIQIADEFIPTTTILWAAGVAANPLNKNLDSELDKQGRLVVDHNLNLPGEKDIFVLGDQAHFETPEKVILPGLAPVAMQQGRYVASLIDLTSKGKKAPDGFIYTDKGQMATIGRSRAVAMYKGLELKGFIAWTGWLVVHIYYLIGFKNRIFVLFQWAWTYLTYRRGARLIVEKE